MTDEERFAAEKAERERLWAENLARTIAQENDPAYQAQLAARQAALDSTGYRFTSTGPSTTGTAQPPVVYKPPPGETPPPPPPGTPPPPTGGPPRGGGWTPPGLPPPGPGMTPPPGPVAQPGGMPTPKYTGPGGAKTFTGLPLRGYDPSWYVKAMRDKFKGGPTTGDAGGIPQAPQGWLGNNLRAWQSVLQRG